MKKQLAKTVSTLLVAAVVLFNASVFAGPRRSSNNLQGVNISYSGLREKQLVFKVDYKNELAQPFQIIISNEFNDIIHNQKYDAAPLNTTLLLSEIPESGKITFTLRTADKEFKQTFEINREVKTVEEVVVKDVK
jgi:hypothetical protein